MRKHIRIEQQLKLHIETVEGRLDELEGENEKLMAEIQRLEQACTDGEWQAKKQVEILEGELAAVRQDISDLESKHKLELRSAEERYSLEKHQIESKLTEAL